MIEARFPSVLISLFLLHWPTKPIKLCPLLTQHSNEFLRIWC
jgi:hypothetical protein